MSDVPFLFVACQRGAESALKAELAANHPEWRFAFSRPGFLTFKWTGASPPSQRLQIHSVFARTYGWSLGSLPTGSEAARREGFVNATQGMVFQHLHVWTPETVRVGSGVYEELTPETQAVAEAARVALTPTSESPLPINRQAKVGERVCDLIVLGPDQYWVGQHQVQTYGQRWAGGVPVIVSPEDMVSRAYLKMTEALLWSELPCRPGDRCVELGSAPGGASQALLERGLKVIGIDPAKMDPRVLANPGFQHIQKRGAEVRRKELRGVKWLMADANVAPQHTLDTVEALVSHEDVAIHGMLLTLKLLDWKLAASIPAYVERVRGWGYSHVRCRQLACNHQEICLAALRSRGMRRRRTAPRSQAARK